MGRPRLRILISCGPTREPIDPVRFLSNYSTGYMGAQLATIALARGHRVIVVSGPGTEPVPSGARVIAVERAHEMERAIRRHGRHTDVVIMAAAVSDFRVARPAAHKLSRAALPRSPHRTPHNGEGLLPRPRRGGGKAVLNLRLHPVPDIVARLPRRKHQLRVGFALETHGVVSGARRKLRDKHLDLLLAQDAGGANPFGRRKVRAWLLTRRPGAQGSGEEVVRLGELSKARVARVLLDKIEVLWYGQSVRVGHGATRTRRS